MLTQNQLEQLLNRSLTSAEVSNLDLYLEIAAGQLSARLCFIPEIAPNPTAPTTRLYDTRQGYRTIFTAPFVGTPVVSVEGVVQDASGYTVRQFDSLNGSWFNSIVFKSFLSRDIETVSIEADWGFDALPSDLSLVIANLFNMQSVNSSGSSRVKSKKVEDFSITYSDSSEEERFNSQYSPTIAKYSICNQTNVRSGNVYDYYGYPFPYWNNVT